MSFEIQELWDIIRVVVLINLGRGIRLDKSPLKHRIDRVCANYVCVEVDDLDRTLTAMVSEGLLINDDGVVELTEQGSMLGKGWRALLMKKSQ